MKRVYFLIWVSVTGLLSLAAVAKKQDAIVDTQADPVSYQEIQKEEAEGKKGPPAPSMDLFPKQDFLTDAPVDEPREELIEPITADEDLDLWLEEEDAGSTDEFQLDLETDDTVKGAPFLTP